MNIKDAVVWAAAAGAIVGLVLLGQSCTKAVEETGTVSNRVTWDEVTTYENGEPITGKVRYWLYQNDASIATVRGTEYTVPGLLFDVEYCYTVRTVVSEPTGDNTSDYSAPACATATETEPTPPPGGGEPTDPEEPKNVTVSVTITATP